MIDSFSLIAILYLSPTIVACARRAPHVKSIALCNVLLGWTGIGWLFALAYALNNEEQAKFPSTTPLVIELPTEEHVDYLELKDELSMFSDESLAPYTNAISLQISAAHDGLHAILENLDRKLNPHELAYSRYLAIAKNTYSCIIDNSSVAVSLLRTASSLRIKRNSQEIPTPPREASLSTIGTSETRSDIAKSQLEKVDKIWSQNEISLTSFAKLNACIAELNIVNGRIPEHVSSAVEEIENAIARAKFYNERPI